MKRSTEHAFLASVVEAAATSVDEYYRAISAGAVSMVDAAHAYVYCEAPQSKFCICKSSTLEHMAVPIEATRLAEIEADTKPTEAMQELRPEGDKRRLTAASFSLPFDSRGVRDIAEGGLPVSAPRSYLVVVLEDNRASRQKLRRLRELIDASASIHALALQSTERGLRRLLVDTTMRRRDLNSFLYHSLLALQARVPFEGGSVFLWDSKRRLLRLHATTGMRDKGKGRRFDRYYRADEDQRMTVAVAKRGHAWATEDVVRDHPVPVMHEEFTRSARKSFVAVPIFDFGHPGMSGRANPLGVLRLVNRVGERAEPRPFSWLDMASITFAAEFMGVVTNYLKKGKNEQDQFERVIHGIKAQTAAVRDNLQLFVERPGSMTVNVPEMAYIIPDCVALSRDIAWQVSRNIDWSRSSEGVGINSGPQLCHVRLFGDVVAKLAGTFKEMARATTTHEIEFHYVDYEAFRALPTVVGEPTVLLNAFRNLFENALKYCRRNSKESALWISSREDGACLEVLVEDNGIGVPIGEEEYIFIDGYRSDNAMRRRPAGGAGIGLPHARELLRAVGGDVYFERSERTRFVVRLQKA